MTSGGYRRVRPNANKFKHWPNNTGVSTSCRVFELSQQDDELNTGVSTSHRAFEHDELIQK